MQSNDTAMSMNASFANPKRPKQDLIPPLLLNSLVGYSPAEKARRILYLVDLSIRCLTKSEPPQHSATAHSEYDLLPHSLSTSLSSSLLLRLLSLAHDSISNTPNLSLLAELIELLLKLESLSNNTSLSFPIPFANALSSSEVASLRQSLQLCQQAQQSIDKMSKQYRMSVVSIVNNIKATGDRGPLVHKCLEVAEQSMDYGNYDMCNEFLAEFREVSSAVFSTGAIHYLSSFCILTFRLILPQDLLQSYLLQTKTSSYTMPDSSYPASGNPTDAEALTPTSPTTPTEDVPLSMETSHFESSTSQAYKDIADSNANNSDARISITHTSQTVRASYSRIYEYLNQFSASDKNLLDASVAFSYLFLGDFRGAANSLLRVTSELPDDNCVCSTNEFVSILCLSVCASYLRGEVKKNILDNENIRKLLEYGRGWREILVALAETNYSTFLQLLSQKGDEFLYSYRIAPFWKVLHSQIRENCFADYARPFSVMTIQGLAEAFHFSFKEAENICMLLIENRRIKGRVDMETGVIICSQTNHKNSTPVSVQLINTLERYLMNVQFASLQSSGLEHDFIIQK